MNKEKGYSLYLILGIIITSVVVLIMSALLTYNYFTTKSKLINELNSISQISLNRIKNSISPFIESYSMNDYEKLIINEMNDKTIYAIVVDDYFAADILGKKMFFNGKIRDKNWNIITYNPKSDVQKHTLERSFLKVSSVALSTNGQQLGKITVYYTDEFLVEELNALIKNSFSIIFTISLILILVLFLSINKLILQPIEKIVNTLAQQDHNGIPLEYISGKGSKEFSVLAKVINKMLSTIKTSQEELNSLNERFQLTLDAVNDGIWDWDIVSDKCYFSNKWKSMLGYNQNDIENKGSVFLDLIHKDDKEKLEVALKKHFENPLVNKFSLQIRLKCKDQSYKWILTRGKVILDEKNNPYRMVGYHTDITIEKLQEEDLKQKDQKIAEQSKLVSMGEMIGNIAHQWRQPLSIISTGATGLKLQNEYDILTQKSINETCDIINENAQYLSKTIDDFRDFIKDNKDKVTFNLSETISSFLTLIKGTVKNHDITIELDLDDSIRIFNFENQLIQCLINIFNNSKDALFKNETKYVFVSTCIKNNNAVIIFKDNAGGIPSNILPRIFEPYFTTKHKSQGTGLGLHITYNLITVGMGGTIKVKNVNFTYTDTKYDGVEFTITLPLS